MPLPLDPTVMLEGVVPASCSVFKSAMAPIRLTFKVKGTLTKKHSTPPNTVPCVAMLHKSWQGHGSRTVLFIARSTAFSSGDEEAHVILWQLACVGYSSRLFAGCHVCVIPQHALKLACCSSALVSGYIAWSRHGYT